MEGVKLATWNVGGGKLLALDPIDRKAVQADLKKSLLHLTSADEEDVDIVMLQELAVVERANSPAECLVEPPDGYWLKWARSIDSSCQTYPNKWQPLRKTGKWDKDTHIGLGLGFMWKKTMSHTPLWEKTSASDRSANLQLEKVRFDTGLYTGSRDSEPRLALVARFLLDVEKNKFVDLMIVNLHLTTLLKEREGIPRLDELGSQIRRQQVKVILDGIVSRYNMWRSDKKSHTRPPAIWILAGDFNCAASSYEVEYLNHMNFVDLNPHKGMGTKSSGRGNEATITLDYIFAGPHFVALDDYVVDHAQKASSTPKELKGSDHYPIVAKLPIPKQARKKRKD